MRCTRVLERELLLERLRSEDAGPHYFQDQSQRHEPTELLFLLLDLSDYGELTLEVDDLDWSQRRCQAW